CGIAIKPEAIRPAIARWTSSASPMRKSPAPFWKSGSCRRRSKRRWRIIMRPRRRTAASCTWPMWSTPPTSTSTPLDSACRPTALLSSNDMIELTVLPPGGALAKLILRDDPEKLSPFWNPKRYARETGKKHTGTGIGHFVCVDGFGPVSPEEKEAGLSGHGEAHALAWETKFSRKEGATGVLTQNVKLPILQANFKRTLRMVDRGNV